MSKYLSIPSELTAMLRLGTTTLFIATKLDGASINIANHLIRKYNWKEVLIPNGHNRNKSDRVFSCSRLVDISSDIGSLTSPRLASLWLWLVDEPLLSMNYASETFLSLWTDCGSSFLKHLKISDIVFLSKHAAASGTLSLTVHPVGIPWIVPEDVENLCKSGGLPGRCAPPSPHIGSLYRAIIAETKERGLDAMFQVTLEATHHGPYDPVPVCFVEIGSTENEWINPHAGSNWSECLGNYFCL